MLTLFKERHVVCSNLRYVAASFGNRKLQTAVQRSRMKALAACKVSPIARAQSRYYSNLGTDPSVHLPPLMNTPAFSASILDLLVARYLLRPRIQKYIHDFDMDEFLQAANHAIIIISKALGNKDYEALEGLVAANIIGELKCNVEQLSSLQRQLIPIVNDSFWWTLRTLIILPDGSLQDLDQYNIKIRLGFLHLPNISDMMKANTESSSVYKVECNYEFTTECTNGVAGPWVATIVNHRSF